MVTGFSLLFLHHEYTVARTESQVVDLRVVASICAVVPGPYTFWALTPSLQMSAQ